MGNTWSLMFPPEPGFTEDSLPDLSGKVYIITGSSGGLGKELAGMLYSKNAKVYIAARSESRARSSIAIIEEQHPASTGTLIYLHLDLADLSTIKASADSFLAKESRLDVLFNNAGVMVPAQGSKTVQGYELQLGTNNLGHFLFTQCVYPLLSATAKTADTKDTVRVIWVSSAALIMTPRPAIDFGNMDYHKEETAWVKYRRSKCGNVLHAAEYARRSVSDGVIHMSLDPGLLRTDLQRTMRKLELAVWNMFFRDAKFGAYTELFAGLSPQVTSEHSGGWVASFGRLQSCPRKDLLDEELGRKYWEWTEKQIKQYK